MHTRRRNLASSSDGKSAGPCGLSFGESSAKSSGKSLRWPASGQVPWTRAVAWALGLALVAGCASGELASRPAGLEAGGRADPSVSGQAPGVPPGAPSSPADPSTGGGPNVGGPRVGGSAPGTDAPAPPEVEPLALHVSSPARGSWLSGPTIHVEGELTGGAAPTLSVGGQAVIPGGDGRFAVDVPAQGGLNVIVTTATDGPATKEDRRAVLQDADAEPTAPVEDGAAVKVSRAGFAQISGLLSDYLADLDLETLARGNLPDNVRLQSLRYDRIEVSLTPQEGRIEVRLAVHGLHVDLEADVDVPIVGDLTVGGFVGTDPGVITGHLAASATAEGGLALDLVDSSVDLRGFEYGIDGVPGFIEDWFNGTVRDLAEDTIRDALNDFVIPSLFDPGALQRTVEVLGHAIDLGLLLSRVESHDDGLEIWADTRASADVSLHAGGAVRPQGGLPRLEALSHLDAAASTDLVSRVLHAAWAAGVLDFTLDADSGFESPVPLTVAVLAGPLGEAAQGIDRTQPLELALRPLLPPVARLEKTDHPLVIETGDLLLDVSTPNEGLLVTVALHFIARASFDVQQIADGGDIELSPDLQVEVHADVAETPRGTVKEEALETVVQGLVGALPGLIAQQTFAFGTDALPVRVTLENARLEPDNVAPYLHLRADLGR